MSDEIRRLLAQISTLEEEVREHLREQEQRIAYRVEGRRVVFEAGVREAHRRMREHLLRWLLDSTWRNALSAPFIYGLIVPFALLDLSLAIYQAICFRLYGLPRVPRSEFIVIDRHRLQYLNGLQKLNCVYCGYANGLLAWAREIASVTEQYWCPIKHARRTRGAHERHARFLDYGEAEDIRRKLRELREQLRKPGASTSP